MTAPRLGGVWDNLPEDEYFADPALSVSGMKTLLQCPALFRYQQENGRPTKPAFDYGHAAHKLVLGAGAEICEIDADDWRTNAAKAKRDEAYTAGQIPMLAKDAAIVRDMAAALRESGAAELFQRGRPEQSLFWTDKATGVDLRARLDWLPETRIEQMICPDYKTAISASYDAFQRAMVNFNYHMQAAHYRDGLIACDLDFDPRFVFVVQEKTAPYLVQVFEPNETLLAIGRELNRNAIETFRNCSTTGDWPGYPKGVQTMSAPRWYAARHDLSALDVF